ncbi:DNA replication complex GINS protein PSF1 [Ramicandelaber brevisporus]|nr:DNA replication complex GINS protein PSF1 [Ramicandelaber brevisporus]
MLGDLAQSLALETKRVTAHLPGYNGQLVRELCRQTKSLGASRQSLADTPLSVERELVAERERQCQLAVLESVIRRNKRVLLAYHRQRLAKLEESYWQSGGTIMSTASGDVNGKSGISSDAVTAPESVYLNEYAKLIQDYKSPYANVIDLTADIINPPHELFVEVRVMQDCGDIQTENGIVSLRKDTQHYLRRTDIERLIQQGLLQLIN